MGCMLRKPGGPVPVPVFQPAATARAVTGCRIDRWAPHSRLSKRIGKTRIFHEYIPIAILVKGGVVCLRSFMLTETLASHRLQVGASPPNPSEFGGRAASATIPVLRPHMSVPSTRTEPAAPGQTLTATSAANPRRPSAAARVDATRTRQAKTASRRSDWARRIVFPSWLASLAFHLLLMLTVALTASRPPGFGNRGGPITISAILGDGPAAGLPGAGTGQPKGPGVGLFLGPGPGAAT